ncbi:hypothetical protein LPJ61_004794, partial [Coemansia biformis]
LQLLSGNDVLQGHTDGTSAQLAESLPLRVYPNILYESLEQIVLPMWSSPELVARAQTVAIRPLTALVMMCVGALSADECSQLSMSLAFAQAVPRFLDAPTALVRLSGVVVADRIVALSSVKKRGQSDGDKGGTIDFGLDDIVREAQTTGQPHARASADYISEMRGFAAPIVEQWVRDGKRKEEQQEATPDGGLLASAADCMRAYGGAEYTEDNGDVVLAPRQTSLTDDARLSSSYVRPRKPVFLRDCLAYLKSSNKDENTEKAEIALFALTDCIEKANIKTVEEQWMPIANKVLYMYNRGPDNMDAVWDSERQKILVALTTKLPMRL